MSKASSCVGRPAQSIANEDLHATSPGGNFEITIDGVIVNGRPLDKGKLGELFEVCMKIDKVIMKVLGGIRKNQHFEDIQSRGLLVLLHCFTDERFSDVLKDIKSGKMKKNLEQELLSIGVKTKDLVVSIRNMEEVKEIKSNIDMSGKNKNIGNLKPVATECSGSAESKRELEKSLDEAKEQIKQGDTQGALKRLESVQHSLLAMSVGQEKIKLGDESEGDDHASNPDDIKGQRKKAPVTALPEKTKSKQSKTFSQAMTEPQIIVQGGAYFQKPENLINFNDNEYMDLIKKSAEKGYEILKNGGTAVDAVEAAVKILEDSKYFNAGYGSLLNCDGEVECDAMIMDGNTLKNGAVISGRHFRNPVSLAKLIMNDTHHCALSGEGALKFAVEKGFLICDQNDLIAEHAKESKIPYSKFPSYVCKRFKSSDTVSAVARDKYGHLACAMSTGGVPGTLKGRVSDASLVGCGGYANEHGAATTSGLGESLMTMTLARDVVYMMESGKSAQEAAERALCKMRNKFQDSGLGGVIAIDKEGRFGNAFTTDMMGWASKKKDELRHGITETMDQED